MTQDSYNNYISNMAYMHSFLCASYAEALKLGKCTRNKLGMDVAISDACMTVLADWKLDVELSTTTTYSVTGVQGLIGINAYLMVAVTQSDISEFHVGDEVTLDDGTTTYTDEITDIIYQAGYRYFEFASHVVVGGFTYTMTKSATIGVGQNNFLSVDEMKEIADLMNIIHGTTYCVDFVLT